MISLLIALVLQSLALVCIPTIVAPLDSQIATATAVMAATLIISLLLGILSRNPAKYGLPLILAIIFIPSAFWHPDGNTAIYAVGCFLCSLIGVGVGSLLRKIFKKD